MNPLSWLKLASVAATLTVLAALAILIPSPLWTSAAIVAAVLCALLVGGLFWITSPAASGAGDNAAALASIGPSSVLAALLIPWSACAIAVAVNGNVTLAWVMNVLTVGGFIAATAILKFTTVMVNRLAEGLVQSPRTQWASQLVALAGISQDVSLKNKLNRLADDLRFSPSDVHGKTVAENESIASALAVLSERVYQEDFAAAFRQVDQLKLLFASRAQGLQDARSKV